MRTIEFYSKETAQLVAESLKRQGFQASATGIELFTDAPFNRTEMNAFARQALANYIANQTDNPPA